MVEKLDCSTSLDSKGFFSVNRFHQNSLSLKDYRVRKGFSIFKHIFIYIYTDIYIFT